MESVGCIDDVSERWMQLITDASQLLILGSLAVVATIVYAARRGFRSAYSRQGRRFSRCRLTGREAVRLLLEHLGLPSDNVEDGARIDHYDLWRRRVKLRTESSVSSSVAALAIAAHEVGHAEQFARGYWAARATRWLLILLVASAAVLFVYPFAAPLAGAGEANLTRLIALLTIFPVLRLPITMALERDATRRAKRLLNETKLADPAEQAGIAELLAAAFRTHLAFSLGLVLMVGACAAVMSIVESGLSMPLAMNMQVAVASEFNGSGKLPPIGSITPPESYGLYAYQLVMISFSVVLVYWAFRSKTRKAPARSAIQANNEGMARYLAGDVEAAIAGIEEALRKDPGLATAHYNRAVVLASQRRTAEALASIETMFGCRSEELEPYLSIADLWFLRGTLRLDQGDYIGAIDDLSRALDFDPPERAAVIRNRGLAWIKLGELDRALDDTDAALALAPEDAVAYNNRVSFIATAATSRRLKPICDGQSRSTPSCLIHASTWQNY
jgi:Zn-dependent membrane protease YugP